VSINDIISSGLLEEYVLGIASEENTRHVEHWMNIYPEIKREVEEMRSSMERYAESYSMKPSAAVKDKIFARISDAQPETTPVVSLPKEGTAKVVTMRSNAKWLAAASVLLLVVSLVLNYIFYNKYDSINNELAVTRQQLDEQKQLAGAMNQDMEVVKNKEAMPVVLNGTPHTPDALAKIFWMKNTGDVYVEASNLPAVPAGKQYQLWAIVDGKPVDAGMISNSKKDIYHIQKMKSFGKAEAFAITLEKQGGSPTPTMEEMVVIAKIKI
jgi:anti-sigma-K factor RskA